MVAIADDLTGAADCAAACAARGVSAAVVLHSPGDVDITSPETRDSLYRRGYAVPSSEQAAETTAELIRRCRKRAPNAGIFKKVDSTLRGNLAAELVAVLRSFGGDASRIERRSILLSPALPAQGRTTMGGHLMVHGLPLHETDLWKDEASPPRSDIADHLADANLSCRVVELTAVRSGLNRLRAVMKKFAAETDVVVCDAETDDDLCAIANAAVEVEFAAWSGSAGLASQLPGALGMKSTEASPQHAEFAAGPTLFVAGSAASVTREQAKVLAAASDVVAVPIAPDALDAEAESKRIVEALRSGRDVLMMLAGERYAGNEAQNLRNLLAKLLANGGDLLGGVVATGGATARAVLDSFGIRRLRLLGEVEPGLPISVADGWTRPLPVLTKAGGFGSGDTLLRCREFLMRLERGTAGRESETKSLLREY